MDEYIRIEDVEGGKKSLYERVADGRRAIVKNSWFKSAGATDIHGRQFLVARNRVKALRLYWLDWDIKDNERKTR